MSAIVIFGLGYSARRIADLLLADGWRVAATGSAGDLAFADDDAVRAALAAGTHVLSSVPPTDGAEPVLARYGDALAGKRLAYLSSTGVYGDTRGAWVDETAAIGRSDARAAADAAWLALGARVLRLPGIYGPGRSALDRVRGGTAHRIELVGALAEQVFSRIHVDDLAEGAMRALAAPAGAYNLADDLPAPQNAPVEEACRLLGVPLPPLVALEDAGLSPMARGLYAENRRVAAGKAKRMLGWRPRYPTWCEGLAAIAGEA